MVILIDDDKLIHASWKMQAKSKSITLKCFFSVNEFIEDHQLIPSETLIYIDSDLGKGQKGEVLSQRLHELGFSNLKLCTGYLDLDISPYPWLSGVINKRPPF